MTAAETVGRVHSRPIHPNAIIPNDFVLMIRADGREEMIQVSTVSEMNVYGRGYIYDKASGRHWELVYRPAPNPAVLPHIVRPWQKPFIDQDQT